MNIRRMALPALAGIALASTVGCAQLGLQSPVTAAASGKPQVSAAVAGADIVQVAQIVDLARAVYETQAPNGGNAQVVADLVKAHDVLVAVGGTLDSSAATSGDLKQNIDLAVAAVQSAIQGLGVVDPKDEAKVKGYLDAFRAALVMYNTHAAAAGLPAVPVTF